MRLCIAMMGLPRSGKSTIAKYLSGKYGAPIVNRDSIRLALHGQRFVPEAEPFVKAISDVMLRSLFITGHNIVIVDETNYSRSARDTLKSDGWDTVFYELKIDPDVCKERAIITEKPDLIPVIDSMYSRYEPLGSDEKEYSERS